MYFVKKHVWGNYPLSTIQVVHRFLQKKNKLIMKTPLFIFCLIIILSGCKRHYTYNIYQLEHCLETAKTNSRVRSDKDVFKFTEGLYFYENCKGYKEIDGVKVNWLEDNDCSFWSEVSETQPLIFPTKKRGKIIDSLTHNLTIPQRFFLIFLDEKRVIYFTNNEASRFFHKRVKSIYKKLGTDEFSLDTLVRNQENMDRLNEKLVHYFNGKGWNKRDYAFANFNLFNWRDSLFTFNQEIPLMENNWRKSMKGVYHTYKDSSTFYLKIAFDIGTLKVKKSNKTNVGASGIIELVFKSQDASYTKLELEEMNIPDESVNLKGEGDKGSRRRNLTIKNTFAKKPIFRFHAEPLKLITNEHKKISHIDIKSIDGEYVETWFFDDGATQTHQVSRNHGWWEK